jgi:hypothetical protein
MMVCLLNLKLTPEKDYTFRDSIGQRIANLKPHSTGLGNVDSAGEGKRARAFGYD